MTNTEQEITESERIFQELLRERYGCPECNQHDGMMGTVSCSNCGYIKPEARA